MTDRVFWATTIFGAKTHKGLVRLELDGNELVLLEPDNARELALNILRAAEAAETDEFIWRFATSTLNADERTALALLRDMRQFRTLRAAREQEPR